MLSNILPFPLNVPQGSKVYVYDAGTVQEAEVFSDTYYTVANQPLIVDNYGRVNALCESGVYDVKVCDEDDTQLYSIEHLVATESFVDAEMDGKEYVRKDGEWVESEKGLYESGEGLHFGGI